MRSTLVGLATLALTAGGTLPAAAQVSARILVDIPILGGGRAAPVIVHRAPPPTRVIVVHEYSSRRHGNWKKQARHWRPVTLWVRDGRYYGEPFRGARQVTVYSYRNQYFEAPRDRDWDRYRVRYERDDWYHDRADVRIRHEDRWDDHRYDREDDRYDRDDDRYDRRWDDRPRSRAEDRYEDRSRRRN